MMPMSATSFILMGAGTVMPPFRAWQLLTGRQGGASAARGGTLTSARVLFMLALPFWGAFLWAIYVVQIRHGCSGDTCIGPSLPALPFPLLYGLAELQLYRARHPGQ